MLTPYQFASNTPIWAIDLDGLEEYFYYFISEFKTGEGPKKVYSHTIEEKLNPMTWKMEKIEGETWILHKRGGKGMLTRKFDNAEDFDQSGESEGFWNKLKDLYVPVHGEMGNDLMWEIAYGLAYGSDDTRDKFRDMSDNQILKEVSNSVVFDVIVCSHDNIESAENI